VPSSDLDLRQKQKIRRRRFASDPLAPIRSDVAALVLALGGNTAVSAIYDIRLGVTAPAGKITQWDDARGSSGFGPSLLPFSTSPGPAYDSAALTATFAGGTSGSLTSASTFSAFDPSAVEAVFTKGEYSAAYSGFEGADASGASLADWLRERDVDAVDVVGIATDHCVRATAADAVAAGFTTRVLVDLTAGVSPTTTAAAVESLRASGVAIA